MKENLGSRKVIVKGKEVFIGIDVHKVSWHVTARTGGEDVFHGGIPGQYKESGLFFSDFRFRYALHIATFQMVQVVVGYVQFFDADAGPNRDC
jgi:hypothetical protein